MSSWSSTYLIAGMRLEIASSAGDPTAFFPRAMPDFTSRESGTADLAIFFSADEEAQADPLRRFFPSHFTLEASGEGLSFDGKGARSKHMGFISAGCSKAELGLPHLDRPWRIAEEEEAVREAIQAFVRACLQCRLMEEEGTFMHAAGVSWEGNGYVFTGHTRAGKTTLSREFPTETVLGDDLVVVRKNRGGFTLYGTPWPGREGGTVAYGGAPLRAVFNLHPELETGLYRQSPAEALAELATNAPRLEHAEEESKLLAAFSSLVQAVPIYRLSLRLGDDAIPYLRQVSSKVGGGDREIRP